MSPSSKKLLKEILRQELIFVAVSFACFVLFYLLYDFDIGMTFGLNSFLLCQVLYLLWMLSNVILFLIHRRKDRKKKG